MCIFEYLKKIRLGLPNEDCSLSCFVYLFYRMKMEERTGSVSQGMEWDRLVYKQKMEWHQKAQIIPHKLYQKAMKK